MIIPGFIDSALPYHPRCADGVIRRSHSPWSSNAVLARKKDGRLLMCIDYRQLNQRTIKDSYSLPRIDEMFDTLRDSGLRAAESGTEADLTQKCSSSHWFLQIFHYGYTTSEIILC